MTQKQVGWSSYISFSVSIVLMAVKFWGFRITQSQAVFSDAMESIVNVAAAALAIFVLRVAAKPADKDHPYGHGKVEYFSAAFEGGLVAFAAIIICFEAVRAMIHGRAINEPGLGLLIVLGTGVANLILGLFLYSVGKRGNSIALMASGKHVMSDFMTSAGVGIGLGLVALTGIAWIDPLCALIVGLLLTRTGYLLVRQSVGGLLDEEDTTILNHLLKSLTRERPEGIIQVHHCRVMRSGSYHHIDAHAVVPEYWDVAEAHAQMDHFEKIIMTDYPYDGELHLHMDPCRRAYCRVCEVSDCPIRVEPFVARRELDLEELTSPEEPLLFSRRSKAYGTPQ